jgi:hypothetical protein
VRRALDLRREREEALEEAEALRWHALKTTPIPTEVPRAFVVVPARVEPARLPRDAVELLEKEAAGARTARNGAAGARTRGASGVRSVSASDARPAGQAGGGPVRLPSAGAVQAPRPDAGNRQPASLHEQRSPVELFRARARLALMRARGVAELTIRDIGVIEGDRGEVLRTFEASLIDFLLSPVGQSVPDDAGEPDAVQLRRARQRARTGAAAIAPVLGADEAIHLLNLTEAAAAEAREQAAASRRPQQRRAGAAASAARVLPAGDPLTEYDISAYVAPFSPKKEGFDGRGSLYGVSDYWRRHMGLLRPIFNARTNEMAAKVAAVRALQLVGLFVFPVRIAVWELPRFALHLAALLAQPFTALIGRLVMPPTFKFSALGTAASLTNTWLLQPAISLLDRIELPWAAGVAWGMTDAIAEVFVPQVDPTYVRGEVTACKEAASHVDAVRAELRALREDAIAVTHLSRNATFVPSQWVALDIDNGELVAEVPSEGFEAWVSLLLVEKCPSIALRAQGPESGGLSASGAPAELVVCPFRNVSLGGRDVGSWEGWRNRSSDRDLGSSVGGGGSGAHMCVRRNGGTLGADAAAISVSVTSDGLASAQGAFEQELRRRMGDVQWELERREAGDAAARARELLSLAAVEGVAARLALLPSEMLFVGAPCADLRGRPQKEAHQTAPTARFWPDQFLPGWHARRDDSLVAAGPRLEIVVAVACGAGGTQPVLEEARWASTCRIEALMRTPLACSSRAAELLLELKEAVGHDAG